MIRSATNYYSNISNRTLLSQLLSPLSRLSVVRTQRFAVAAPGDCRRACESARAQSPRPTRGAAKHCENGTRQRCRGAPEHVFLVQLTWGATVRGTYPTPEAGTRTQYVLYVGPWGEAALRLRYVHNAGGWYA